MNTKAAEDNQAAPVHYVTTIPGTGESGSCGSRGLRGRRLPRRRPHAHRRALPRHLRGLPVQRDSGGQRCDGRERRAGVDPRSSRTAWSPEGVLLDIPVSGGALARARPARLPRRARRLPSASDVITGGATCSSFTQSHRRLSEASTARTGLRQLRANRAACTHTATPVPLRARRVSARSGSDGGQRHRAPALSRASTSIHVWRSTHRGRATLCRLSA